MFTRLFVYLVFLAAYVLILGSLFPLKFLIASRRSITMSAPLPGQKKRREATQNKSISSALDSDKKNDAGSAASFRTRKRKRSLDLNKVDKGLTTTPLNILKRAKTGSTTSKTPFKGEQPTESHLPIINKVPTEKLIILVFGCGDAGELGLGSKRKEALRPCRNPLLDVDNPSAFHVVQLACGGMHTVALTADNKIITWGVNDNNALGRDTEWDGKLCDIDADSEEDEDGELNPLESSPMEITSDCFTPGTRFVQVAAGDSCSFALTDTGLVYGWGTFRVSYISPCKRPDSNITFTVGPTRPPSVQA